MIVAFFEDKECVRDFHPISEYLNPAILRFYDRHIFEKWKKAIGADSVGLLGRVDVAKASSWYTSGLIDAVDDFDEDAFLINSCANIFSDKIVGLLAKAARHEGQVMFFKGSRVLAAKLYRDMARSSLDIFNRVLEPELLANYIGFVEAIPIVSDDSFISPRIFIKNLLRGGRVAISQDSVFENNVVLRGSVYIGPGVQVRSNSVIENSIIERNSIIEGTVRQAYVSANSLVQGYVEKAFLGPSTILYPYSVVKGCCPITGLFVRILPGTLIEGSAKIGHGCELRGVFRDKNVEKLIGFYDDKSSPLEDVYGEYRNYLYSLWKRLPSKYEEALLKKK